jgi:tryptophan halogenase
MTDQQALDALMPNLMGKPLMHEPRRIGFRPGPPRPGLGQELRLAGPFGGLPRAAGEHQHRPDRERHRTAEVPVPGQDLRPSIIDEFNDQSAREMERTRDFIILHYKAERPRRAVLEGAARGGHSRHPGPQGRALWKARGQFVRYRWEMFHPASWLAIYDGFGVLPEQLRPRRRGAGPVASSPDSLGQMKAAVAETVARTPSHAAFLADGSTDP